MPREPLLPIAPDAVPVADILDVPFVHGHVSPEWRSLAHTFAENFARGEVGASFSVCADGQRVVDLWGGQYTPEGEPWQQDTLAVFFSCSKILTALAVHRLLEAGVLELDQPLTALWPELRAAQQGATLRMLLSHTVGLPALSRRLPAGTYNDHAEMVRQLEQQEPLWVPGTQVGYHPITFGFLLGEVVRRATGASIGHFIEQHFSGPLGLDLYIGLPAREFDRVAPVLPYRPHPTDPVGHVARASQSIGSIQNLWLFNSGGWRLDGLNQLDGVLPEIPAANGVGNARSLASLLDSFNDPERRSALGFSEETVANLEAVTAASHRDATLLCRSRFSLGLMKSMDNRDDPQADNFIIGRRAFGHVGMGGSFGFCDREAGLSAAYVMNQQGPGILLNARGQRLVDAIYRHVGFQAVRAGAWHPG